MAAFEAFVVCVLPFVVALAVVTHYLRDGEARVVVATKVLGVKTKDFPFPSDIDPERKKELLTAINEKIRLAEVALNSAEALVAATPETLASGARKARREARRELRELFWVKNATV
jgi:hypothetical protein